MTPLIESTLVEATPAAAPAARMKRRIIAPAKVTAAARPGITAATAGAFAAGTTGATPAVPTAATATAAAAAAAAAVQNTPAVAPDPCWKVLVVDDEPAIHQVTRLVLGGADMLGRKLFLLHASSVPEASEQLRLHPDVALILLDVVMERDDAGLTFVHHVRRELGNRTVRIVLRTGQPGQAPERRVMVDYDINDYKEKTELTANRLYTSVVAGIRTFRDMCSLERTLSGMATVVESSATLFAMRDLEAMGTEVLKVLRRCVFFEAAALFDTFEATAQEPRRVAVLPPDSDFLLPPALLEALWLMPSVPVSDDRFVAVGLQADRGRRRIVAMRVKRKLEADEYHMVDLVLRNAAIACCNVQLELEAAALARLPAELPEPVMRVSNAGRVMFANDASAGLLAHWQDESPDDWHDKLREMMALSGRQDTEIRVDGRVFEMSMSPVPELGYVNIFGRDVTEVRDAVSRLRYAAYHDELTGLHNRVHFRASLEAAITSAAEDNSAPVGLLMIDLDHFKQINDTLGHAAGDEALRIAARRLKKLLRGADLVARLGGDEFAVLVNRVQQPGELTMLAERLRSGLAQPLTLGSRDWTVCASIGVTSYPRDATTASDLLRCADLAMYHAKRDGRGGVSAYDGEVHRSVRQRVSVEMMLRDAIKHDRLNLHFQPLVELSSGRILGAEALVRMQGPDGNPVSPVEFIPVAEECGLIEEVGEWVLHHALTEAHAWHQQGFPDLRIAVNVSARQLRAPDIVRRFKRVFDSTGIDGSRVEIELTESVLVGNVKEAMARIWDLRGLGADLAVDDFGTGYSSLGYLRSLPVSKLKIDRSFVMDLPGSRDALAIVDAVLSLANSLRLTVVAEGVETDEQADTLRRMGCAQAQGYLYSRPVPAAAFRKLLQLPRLPAPLLPQEASSTVLEVVR
jgi:diguanylate cyclase (GGDEF)-like protein